MGNNKNKKGINPTRGLGCPLASECDESQKSFPQNVSRTSYSKMSSISLIINYNCSLPVVMLYKLGDDEIRLQFAYIRLEMKLSSFVLISLIGSAVGAPLLQPPDPAWRVSLGGGLESHRQGHLD